MNFGRKSTEGFSIGNMLLQLLGGLTGFAQMGVQSIDQGELLFARQKALPSILQFLHTFALCINKLIFYAGTFVNFYGNIGKTLLSLVCNVLLFFYSIITMQNIIKNKIK